MVFAALDTTSSALSATLHMLAKNSHIQDQLRDEILKASSNCGDIPYDTLVDLPLLDAVCRETLRLYVFSSIGVLLTLILISYRLAFRPWWLFLACEHFITHFMHYIFIRDDRSTATSAVLPVTRPITGVNGKLLNEILIPAHTPLYISVLSSNCNPAIWGPDAYEWKPERWIGGLPQTVKDAPTPGIYSHLWVSCKVVLLCTTLTPMLAGWRFSVVATHACQVYFLLSYVQRSIHSIIIFLVASSSHSLKWVRSSPRFKSYYLN